MSFLSLFRGLEIRKEKNNIIEVSGLSFIYFYKGLARRYGSKVINNVFITMNTYSFTFHEFYLLDVVYFLEEILYNKKDRKHYQGLNVAKQVHEKLKELPLVKGFYDVREMVEYPVVDKTKLNGIFQDYMKLYDYQSKFIDACFYKVNKLGLKGYLLDAGPGLGKTVTALAIAELLDVERIIVVCPKKAVLDVWETYIDQYYKKEQNYCLSLNKVKNTSKSNSFDIDKRFYVVHYEAMEMVIDYLNRNPDDNRKTMIILDESHNFNTHDSSRSILFRELCRKANSSFTLWVSGTPFKAMGKEIFSLAYTVDPLFDSSVEKSFFDIYGKNSKMSLEILSNRIQMMRTPIPAKQMTTKLSVHSVKVKVPNGERFILRAVSNEMKKYIEERFRFYQKNMKDYVNDYFNAIEEFKRSSNYKSNKDGLNEYLTITSKFHKHGFNSYDKKDIEDSKKAKAFEEKIIIPSLSSETKKTFRKAKSIYKYVDLAIVGEALGNVLGKARIECNREIIKALGEKRNVIVEWEDGERTQSTIDELIANSVGKTICFTDYIEVVKQLENDLIERNHKPITVFGENTNELNKRVGIFMNDKVTNPLVTTYKSLGEAVPLTVATSVFFLNMPFRSGIEDQAVKRAWRIGNKHDVDLFKVTLDTGTAKNVSTRSEDIAAWSRDMVAVLLKEKSADDVFITKFIEESVINGEEDNSFPTKIKTLIRKAFG